MAVALNLVILAECGKFSNLKDLYKVFQESMKVHGKFVRPARELSVEEETQDYYPLKSPGDGIRSFGEKLPRASDQTSAMGSDVKGNKESEIENTLNSNTSILSPESWLNNFYQKSILPRKTRKENSVDEVEVKDVGPTTQVLPNMIDNSDINVEYIVFYDFDYDTPSYDVLDYEDSDTSLPDSDYNTINLYNKLTRLNPNTEKLETSLVNNASREKNTSRTRIDDEYMMTIDDDIEKQRNNPTDEKSIHLIKSHDDLKQAAMLKEQKKSHISDRGETKYENRSYQNMLNSFFQPQFDFHSSPLEPFRREFNFQFSDPAEKIQSKMKEILKESGSG